MINCTLSCQNRFYSEQLIFTYQLFPSNTLLHENNFSCTIYSKYLRQKWKMTVLFNIVCNGEVHLKAPISIIFWPQLFLLFYYWIQKEVRSALIDCPQTVWMCFFESRSLSACDPFLVLHWLQRKLNRRLRKLMYWEAKGYTSAN